MQLSCPLFFFDFLSQSSVFLHLNLVDVSFGIASPDLEGSFGQVQNLRLFGYYQENIWRSLGLLNIGALIIALAPITVYTLL